MHRTPGAPLAQPEPWGPVVGAATVTALAAAAAMTGGKGAAPHGPAATELAVQFFSQTPEECSHRGGEPVRERRDHRRQARLSRVEQKREEGRLLPPTATAIPTANRTSAIPTDPASNLARE